MSRAIYLSLGANVRGCWGEPRASLLEGLARLARQGVDVRSLSALYQTAPVGSIAQATYVNAVAEVRTSLPPAALMRVIKRIERQAGRRASVRWGPRPLDVDILDYGGTQHGWARHLRSRHSGKGPGPAVRPLILPHPYLHQRAFVLRPLLDIAPHWRHPVLDLPARRFLQGLPVWQRTAVKPLDF